MPDSLAPLDLLQRSDKWYVGGGTRLVWTPPFPSWLETLGFWDEAHYYQFALAPLFTVTLLDEDGRELPYRFETRTWRPDGLTQTYRTQNGLDLTERRVLLPEDVLASELTLRNTTDRPRTLRLVLWTVQENHPVQEAHFLSDVRYDREAFRFRRHTTYRTLPRVAVGCALGMDRPVRSFGAYLSQGSAVQPRWALTPFYETIDTGGLGDEWLTETPTEHTSPFAQGLLYLGLLTDLTLPPGGEETVTFGFAAAPEPEDASRQLRTVFGQGPAGRQSTGHWQRYFERVPGFTCSNPFLRKYYWYRWYGLRLFTLPGGEGNYPYPAVAEGLSYFRVPITYSAQCHILETRWMDTPALGQGSLLNFIAHQQENGGFVGHLYVNHLHPDSFYHANWGHIRQLHANHPDEAFLQKAYTGLSRYAAYFDRERDSEDSGLYDIQNMYETGQEYMHRYMAVAADADQEYWGRHFRLKGIDVTVYLYEVKRALAWMAETLGDPEAAQRWTAGAARTRQAVLEHMWDPEQELFFDVDPRTGERTGVKAAVCFYPYFTDLVDDHHLPGLKRHLFDPETFWTPYPVPSSSRDDPYFSAWARWQGQRKNCPWNGRVWPMTNSHVAEALAQSAIRFNDDELRKKTAEFITRYVGMMFFDGDVERPNCFEHYNPLTGKACVYRGVDDYQHSWVVELLIKYVAGLRPRDRGVTVDPFPFEVEHVRLVDVPVRGHRLGVERQHDRVTAFIDGEPAAEGSIGTPFELSV